MGRRSKIVVDVPIATPAEIKALREWAGYSMREASILLDLASQATYENYEYGRNEMPRPTWKLFRVMTGSLLPPPKKVSRHHK